MAATDAREASSSRYNLTLSEGLNADLEETAKVLGISKAEAIRRSITLMKYAAQADKVQLIRDDTPQEIVVIK